ncbi:hypothetical protein JCM3765_002635 [Sporobolomyces pararoseus]
MSKDTPAPAQHAPRSICPAFPPAPLSEFSPPFDITNPQSFTEYLLFGRDYSGERVDSFVEEVKERYTFLGNRIGDVVADAREYPWIDQRYLRANTDTTTKGSTQVPRPLRSFFEFIGARTEDFTLRLPPKERTLEEEDARVTAAEVRVAFQAVDRGIAEELIRLREGKQTLYDAEASTITLPFNRLISPTDSKRRLGDWNHLKQYPQLFESGTSSDRNFFVLAILRFSQPPDHWEPNDPATDQVIQNHLHSLVVAGLTAAVHVGFPLDRVYVLIFQGVTKLPLLHYFDLIVIYGATGAGLLFFDADVAGDLFDFFNPPPPPPPPVPPAQTVQAAPEDESKKETGAEGQGVEDGKKGEKKPEIDSVGPWKRSARFCFLIVEAGNVVTSYTSSVSRMLTTVRRLLNRQPALDEETEMVLRDLTAHLRGRQEYSKGMGEAMKNTQKIVREAGISSWRNRNAGIQRNLSASRGARKLVAPITGSSLAVASGLSSRLSTPSSSSRSSSVASSRSASPTPSSSVLARRFKPKPKTKQPQTTVVFSKVAVPSTIEDPVLEQARLAEPKPLVKDEQILLRAFPSPETLLASPPAPIRFGPRLPELIDGVLDQEDSKQVLDFLNANGRKRILRCARCEDSFHSEHEKLFEFHKFYHSRYADEIETCKRCGGHCPRRFLRAHIQSCQGQLNSGPFDTREHRKNRFVYWFGY